MAKSVTRAVEIGPGLLRYTVRSSRTRVLQPDFRSIGSDIVRTSIARIMDNVVNHTFGNRPQLKELRMAHRDLDVAITELSTIPHVDQLRIRRLKKEKLRLKDMIVRLESGIGTDIKV